jgi:hypothetical protein
MVTEQYQRCMQACRDCSTECRACADHLTRIEIPDGMELGLECAQACDECVASLLEGHTDHCRRCADLCDRFAGFCESFTDDDQMMRCASSCRACADECKRTITVPAR